MFFIVFIFLCVEIIRGQDNDLNKVKSRFLLSIKIKKLKLFLPTLKAP
jgi:hypothetical protein